MSLTKKFPILPLLQRQGNAMSFSWEDHTADYRIAVEADHLDDLFAEALRALACLQMDDPSGRGLPEPTREIALAIDATDLDLLLVDFLSEVLAHSTIHRVIYWRCQNLRFVHEAHRWRVTASIGGAPIEQWARDIKAITYHDLILVRTVQGGWQARYVVDV